jgi:hypothetical protein
MDDQALKRHWEYIQELTKSPREIETPDFDLVESEELSREYHAYRKQVHQESEHPEPAQLSEQDRKQLSESLPPCIAYILAEMPSNTNFNNLIIQLVTYFQMVKWDKGKIWASLEPFINGYPHSETYNTRDKRLEHWKQEWAYLENNPEYSFNCSYIKGLGLPGYAFECSKCIGPAEEDPTSIIEIVTLGDIHRMEIEFPPPLVEGLLKATDSLLVTGESGLGKSLFTLSLAVAIASGTNLFNQFKIPKARNVLLIQSENGLETTKERLEALLHSYHLTSEQKTIKDAIDRIYTAKMGDDCRLAGNLLDTKFADFLKRTIESTKAGIVMLDPLISYHNENENDNSAMRTVLDAFTMIGSATGVATYISHHHGKGNYHEGADQSRGATAIKDWARGILTLNPQKNNRNKLLVKCDHTKHGNVPKSPSMLLEIAGPMMMATSFQILCPPEMVAEVLTDLGGRVDTKKELVKALIENCNITDKTARTAIDRAEEFDKVKTIKVGRSIAVEIAENGAIV